MSLNEIISLIKGGESQTLDFKFQINDSKKIARSLVAFANTDGGRLLIGVKDNGSIAGVRSDEEYYMAEAAAEMYCQPPVSFSHKTHLPEGKQVVEIVIPKNEDLLHKAKDDEGKWKVYLRRNDENFLANKIYLEVWERQKHHIPARIQFGEEEKILIQYLEKNKLITLNKYCKIAKIKRFKAERILINFCVANLLSFEFTQKGVFYRLNKEILRSTPEYQ